MLFCPAGLTGPAGGSASTTARSFVALHSHATLHPHFAGPGLCHAKTLFGPPKRRMQPERYAPLGLKSVENNVMRLVDKRKIVP
jgi:hypothetical protein